jgi:hypothetical protein
MLNLTKAPAIQLSEHAQAILEDDQRLGIDRKDPVLQRLAQGSSHAVPDAAFFFLHFFLCDM